MRQVTNFREYCFDPSQNVFRAKVDVAGVRGLYRTPTVRTELVERNLGSNVWRLRRNDHPLLEVKALEDAHNRTLEKV